MKASMFLELRLRLSPLLSALQALDVFETLVLRMAITPRTWSATSTGQEPRVGGFAELRSYVTKHQKSVRSFGVDQDRKIIQTHCSKQLDHWNANISAFTADEAWIQQGIDLLRESVGERGLESAEVTRPAQPVFEPHPPIAKACYAVLTTDAQVIASYDEPSVFWESWDKIEPIGKFKLCTRALTALSKEYWLGETFENTMAMVRAAKSKLTAYTGWYQPSKASAPWWEYGDVQDEKAGWPLLDLVGYDPKTRTLEYAAKPNHPGHLLLQEIMTLMNLVDGKTRDGQPIEVVRAVFLDEKQARAEKRPLLDNDIKVYYLGKAGELVELKT